VPAAAESIVARIVEKFLRGNLSVLLILLSLAAGAAALLVTPREEEPQIVVPLADVMIRYPGGGAGEVEKLVSSRLEKMLLQIDGVEYVYSMSRPGLAVVTVRFHVGEDREDSLIKLYTKIESNLDRVTPGIEGWVVKPIEIDDVPIVTATLYSDRLDDHVLYRVAEEVVESLQSLPDTARIEIVGGRPRVARVELDPDRLAAYGLSAVEVGAAIRASNVNLQVGSFLSADEAAAVEVGPYIRDRDELAGLMIGVHADRPVYLQDVAGIVDGPDEAARFVRLGFGPGAEGGGVDSRPAVTIAVAKQKGTNAVRLAAAVEERLTHLRRTLIPDEVGVRITRDYGETANDKVNELVEGLAIAVLTVIGLIAFAMGWREGVIVAIAVPITYSLTLLVNYAAGYTINRVTLFALILALGLLVDDPIVDVENINRHLRLRREPPLRAVLTAVNEVRPPIILATLAVIVSFLPMFFITGMMGPYMRPMALNVPLTMLMSMIVAFTITPWLSFGMLRRGVEREERPFDLKSSPVYRLYRAIIEPLLDSRRLAWGLIALAAALFALSVAMAPLAVPLKMLPFDNKNEFQLVVDLPEGTPLERTDAVVRDIEAFLRTVPEVTDYSSYVGTASPIDFNGMVRHYYMREGPNVADVRVNLVDRDRREQQSHALGMRLREGLRGLQRDGARIKLVEMPPGPPVLASIVAEIRGSPHHSYADLLAAAAEVESRLERRPGVVDVDSVIEQAQPLWIFEVDREKAGLSGISVADVAATLRMALSGERYGTIHMPHERNELAIELRLPEPSRSSLGDLERIPIKGLGGAVVQLGEIGRFRESTVEQTIYRKNLERVVYVTAEAAGVGPAYPVLEMIADLADRPLPAGIRVDWAGEGEWKITLDVFRDLGLAFLAALAGIFVLLTYETRSYALPLIIMISIPLTMIGIMPGFYLLNLLAGGEVGGYEDQIFFTATAMIGMIALSGIVVRNAIILIDFIRNALQEGRPMREAIVESGAVRFRPIFLTAGTTLLGAWPITLDPIFSGLAWSLIFGLLVSTVFTLVIIPVIYFMIYGNRPPAHGGAAGEVE
jgi:multidrug efflux pump subunit AcrB